jgi:hypothetical protein
LDRFTPKIKEYAFGTKEMSIDEYKKKKFFLAYEEGKIDKKELDREIGKDYPEKLYNKLVLGLIEEGKIDIDESDPIQTETFQDALEQYLKDIKEELKEHERKINLVDMNRGLNLSERSISQLQKITRKFLRKIEMSPLATDKVYSWLPSCPSKDQCETGISGACGVYFYGSKLLDPRDLK